MPPTALARWARVSTSPSETAPYYVCPHQARRASCGLIEDPTRKSSRRGPLAAGAITAGPAQEVSPAVYGNGVEGGYSPQDLRSAYDLPSASGGSGQTVAVVDAFDDPKAEADLGVYRSEYGIPQCDSSDGCFRKVNQEGADTSYPAPSRVWAREISLDLDMVSAICPNCHILLVEASTDEEEDLAAAENEAVKLGATEISNSFLGAEAPEYAAAYDHPGVPITAAGGDHGYGVEAPASYPSVIAVGGTSLRPEAGERGWTESVWYSDTDGQVSGTGSGCSHEPKPAWQEDTGCPYRTTNDVAAVADPNTPVSAYDSYETTSPWLLLGGTSASAPIVGAAMALASPYTRSFAGAHALYLEAASDSGFNEILSGSNGDCGSYLCEAGPGYNGPAGLGSLHGAPQAPAPAPATGSASSITQTEATLAATVEPHGVEVDECRFEYGPTGTYGSSAACSSLPGPATGPVTVSASVAGLAANTVYYFRLVIGYQGGSGAGEGATFTTLGYAPAVSTGEPSAVTQSTMTLNAQVTPNGSTVTTCEFEYGRTASYGSTAACAQAPGNGQTPVAVSAAVSGLSANTAYHFRVLASNRYGSNYGSDLTVTLPPQPPSVVISLASSPLQPAIQQPPLSSPTTATSDAAELLATKLVASSNGSLSVQLRCPSLATRCDGTITLQTLDVLDAGGHRSAKSALTLAAGKFDSSGHVVTVRLHLSVRALSLLARSRSRVLHAEATVLTRTATGAAHASQTVVTLRERTAGGRPAGG
ncbi:MAG TPA: hypothetical protein VMF09_02135 [Solirubrobacteraceae bacterium]|nr:hypothetical protein [Solirubrobacteraceae bacterium]